jgi:hypothetical protein
LVAVSAHATHRRLGAPVAGVFRGRADLLLSFSTLDRRDRIAAVASAAILGALIAKGLFRHGIDFHVMYLSGERALSGVPIYLLSDGRMPFKYHPVWAVVFSPVSLLPEKLAYVLFNMAMLGCWMWAASIWARWLGYDIRRPANFLILLLLALNALSSEINLGQTNGLLFVGATKLFEWMSARPQKWFSAGILVAVLCALLAVFCLIRNFRSLLGMVAGAVVLHVIAAAFFGHWLDLDLYRAWLDLLLNQSAEQYVDPDVQGLLRFLLLASPDYGRAFWLLSVALFVLGGLALERYRRADPALIAGYWLSAAYLLSPLAWWNQILFTYPLVFVLLRRDIGRVGRGVLYGALAIYALAGPALLGRDGIQTFRVHHGVFFASVAIIGVMVLSLWPNRPAPISNGNSGSFGPSRL